MMSCHPTSTTTTLAVTTTTTAATAESCWRCPCIIPPTAHPTHGEAAGCASSHTRPHHGVQVGEVVGGHLVWYAHPTSVRYTGAYRGISRGGRGGRTSASGGEGG